MPGWLAAPISGPDAQHAAQLELRKAEYHRDDPGLIDRVLHWLASRLDFVVSGTVGGSASLVVLVLLVGAVALALFRASSQRSVTRAKGRPTDPLQPEPDVDHAGAAERLAAAGDYAEALREWLRAAVATVEGRGVLAPRPGRTAAEFAREAGAELTGAAPALTAAVTAFDLVWFGGQQAEREHAELGRVAAEQVHTAPIARGARAAASGYAMPR
ncbi:MAG: hypothetical protein QOK10_3908 [Pseudonocardiales bacterium]|jgi:hypothetical protein|nr:hypothetical protein [Pseudonocardiales bacterium]